MRKNNKELIITNENESNISTGGDCNVFEILDSLKTAMQYEPALEQVLSTLKPDILLAKNQNPEQVALEYSILKIANKIAKSGKSGASVF
jgi:hypothetical protein